MEDVDEDGGWYGGDTDKRVARRESRLPRSGLSLAIMQDTEYEAEQLWAMGCGNVVWEAAAATLRALDAEYSSKGLHGLRVLELGAGTGVCGIACAALGASAVILTDKPDSLQVARKNALACPWSDVLQVQALDWSDPEAGAGFEVDFVIACDCLYQSSVYPALAATIARLGAPCLLSWVCRGKHESTMLDMLCKDGAFESVAVEGHADDGVAIVRATPRPSACP